MRFDEFTVQQLAGDMLPKPTDDQLIATAFHRNTMTNSEGGTDDEEFRNAAIVDRVDTTMQVWMGLTMGCARCHTHKYDPISQEEYFRFFAILNNTADADRGDESPTLVTMTAELEEQKTKLQADIAKLERELQEKAAASKTATSQADRPASRSLHSCGTAGQKSLPLAGGSRSVCGRQERRAGRQGNAD